MPTGVVEDQNVAPACEADRAVRLVEKRLKHIPVTMTGIEPSVVISFLLLDHFAQEDAAIEKKYYVVNWGLSEYLMDKSGRSQRGNWYKRRKEFSKTAIEKGNYRSLYSTVKEEAEQRIRDWWDWAVFSLDSVRAGLSDHFGIPWEELETDFGVNIQKCYKSAMRDRRKEERVRKRFEKTAKKD